MSASIPRNVTPRPFLKWAGGKRQLLNELLARVDAAAPFGRYFEPFFGGGALFFELARSGRLRSKARLSDVNPNIMDAYLGVRDHVEAIIEILNRHKERHCKDYYYEVRANVPRELTGRAARFIYLNRTCFNGIYRENSKGRFNVPMGRYRDPPICDQENLRAAAKVLKRTRIDMQPFERVEKVAKAGDLVYFDPPYHPVSKTASFTSYDKNGFGEDAQRRLAEVYANLAEKGVKVLLSNSMTPLVNELYSGFHIDEVLASRTVNSRASARGPVPEALVQNF